MTNNTKTNRIYINLFFTYSIRINFLSFIMTSSCCASTDYGTHCCCGVYFPWTSGDRPKTETDPPLLEEHKEIELADRSFAAFKSLLKAHHFLPDSPLNGENSLSRLRVTQLVYLSNLEEDQSPLTEQDEKIIKTSNQADNDTRCWLRVGIVAGTALIIGGWVVAFPAAIAWSEGRSISVLPPIASLGMQVVGGIMSYVSTGTNPHFASEAADDRQDRIQMLSDLYSKLAAKLIELESTNPDLATEIATQLDIKKIKTAIHKKDPREIELRGLTALEIAKCKILKEAYPPDVILEHRLLIRALESETPPSAGRDESQNKGQKSSSNTLLLQQEE